MGCPEVPVQMALGIYLAYKLDGEYSTVTLTGNPAVLNLARVSDPGKQYVHSMVALDRCMEELIEKRRLPNLCVVMAHNDGRISYAATIRYHFTGRLVLIIFGRNAEALSMQVDFPCEKIVDKAVHNPMKLRQKIDEVFRWGASKT